MRLPAKNSRKLSGGPWPGLRERLIHDYVGVDYDIVWDVIQNKVPTLGQEIQRIIEEMMIN